MESLFQVCVYAFKTLIEAFYQDNRRAMSCEKLVKHADFGKNGMVKKPLGNKISADMEEYSSNPVGVYEGQALVDEPVALSHSRLAPCFNSFKVGVIPVAGFGFERLRANAVGNNPGWRAFLCSTRFLAVLSSSASIALNASM